MYSIHAFAPITGKFSSLIKTGKWPAGFSSRNSSDSTYSISSRAENHLASKLINLELENVNRMNLIGGEFAFVKDAFSIQGEYILNSVDASQTFDFSGYYGQVSYFLTGEKRKYKIS